MKKKISFGWILIILQVLGYIGCLLPNNSIPINNIAQFIGFNLIGIIGIIKVILDIADKQDKKDSLKRDNTSNN